MAIQLKYHQLSLRLKGDFIDKAFSMGGGSNTFQLINDLGVTYSPPFLIYNDF